MKNKKTQLDKDVDYVLTQGKYHAFLDTISTLFLDDFYDEHTKCNSDYGKLRARYRRALNECYKRGHCKKHRAGTTIYQTGDAFGGKSCIMYDFTEQYKNEL